MTVYFRNRVDTRGYAAAEDAYTSEGGYLAPVAESRDGGDRYYRPAPGDFGNIIKRCAAGVRAAWTDQLGGASHASCDR